MVFDDYHAIKNQEVHDVCSYLLNNIPASIHLIITSRMDPSLPLAYLMLHNDLFELRLPQLRFETEETRSIFEWKHGKLLSLQGNWTNFRNVQTDGLPVCSSWRCLSVILRIISNALIYCRIRTFQTIHLSDKPQVLSQQPDDIPNFLLETSILAELNTGIMSGNNEKS